MNISTKTLHDVGLLGVQLPNDEIKHMTKKSHVVQLVRAKKCDLVTFDRHGGVARTTRFRSTDENFDFEVTSNGTRLNGNTGVEGFQKVRGTGEKDAKRY